MQIIIRSLNNADAALIANLILPIQQIEFNVPITLKDQPDLLDIETCYLKDGGNFWGAFCDEKLAGTIALIHAGPNTGVIRKMFVDKAFRGGENNIAQRLFETLITFCKMNAITNIYLGTVNVMKAAHRFYERNGFKEIQKGKLPSYFPLMVNDNVFYHLQLN